MPWIQHTQEDRQYNLQPTSDDITKVAHFFEVFFYNTKFQECRQVASISKFSWAPPQN
jgi:hypothetical protein